MQSFSRCQTDSPHAHNPEVRPINPAPTTARIPRQPTSFSRIDQLSPRRRVAARRRVTALSAVASVSTPVYCQLGYPSGWRLGDQCYSPQPQVTDDPQRGCKHPSTEHRSYPSEGRQAHTTRYLFQKKLREGGSNSGHTSNSQCGAIISNPKSGIRRVTKTRSIIFLAISKE